MQRVMWTESLVREAGGASPLETVRVTLDGRELAVLPLWIAVHQPQDGGPARFCPGCSVQKLLRSILHDPTCYSPESLISG